MFWWIYYAFCVLPYCSYEYTQVPFFLCISSHHNAQMATIIFNAGHRLAFRAPYYPVDGPIEYVFNTIQFLLQINNDAINDGPSLQQELNLCITDVHNFEPYFEYSGYWRT